MVKLINAFSREYNALIDKEKYDYEENIQVHPALCVEVSVKVYCKFDCYSSPSIPGAEAIVIPRHLHQWSVSADREAD